MTTGTIGRLILAATLGVIAPSSSWAGICTADGAFGVKFGAKLPKKAQRGTNIDYWASPFILPYFVDAPDPDDRFDRYVVRTAGDDGEIFDVIGLEEVPYIPSPTEYNERIVPLLKPFAEKFGENMNLVFEQRSPHYFTAKDDYLEYQVFFLGARPKYYMAVSCIHRDFQKAAEGKALKAWQACEKAAKSDMHKCMSEGVP